MKAITVIAALAALIVCMDAAVQPAEASLVHWTMPRLTNRPFLGMQWRDPFEEFNRMWNNVIAEQQRVWSCQKHCSAVAARALSSSVTVTESDLPSGETALVHTFPGVRAADVSVEVTGDRLSVRASRPLATSSPTAARDAECGCPVDSESTATSITTVTSNGLCRTRTVSTAPGTTPVETVERVYTLPRYTASDAVTASLTEHATADGMDVASELTIHIPKAVLPQAKAVPIAVTKTVAPPAAKPAIAAAPEAAASPAPVPAAAASSASASAPAPAPATPKSVATPDSDIIDLDRN